MANGTIVRLLLWLGLGISAVCNIVASAAHLQVLIGIAFGVLTVSFGAGLVVHHYRYQRR